MAVIAISQQIGSRGIELGELAARELGYRFQTGEQLIAETAKRFNVSAEQMKWFDVHAPHFWERKTESTPLRRVLSRRLPARGRAGSDRRGRTRLVAFSARRRMRHQGAHDGSGGQSHQAGGEGREARRGGAEKRVRDFDAEVKARIQSLFGQDIEDPAIYDLVDQHRAPAAGVARQHAGGARDSYRQRGQSRAR